MKLARNLSLSHWGLAAVLLMVPHTWAQAQTIPSEKTAASNPIQKDDKREEKAEDIEVLRSQVKALQALVEQQQRALAEIQRRLDQPDGKPRVAAQVLRSGADSMMSAESPDTRTGPLEVNQTSRSAAEASQAKATEKAAPLAGWNDNHAFLRSPDGKFETQISGYAQLDFRGYGSGNHPPNTLLIRRARLSLEGKLDRYFDFRIEGDFADTTSTLLRDFYVRIHRIDEFQLTFGQFRVPISQEEIRTDNNQDFIERSMVNNLVPSRSPGVMASGLISKGVFEYQIGVFNGKGLLASNNNGTPETAIRLRFTPWKHGQSFVSKGFSFGGAFTQGRSLGGTSVRGQTESRSFSFFVPDTINGKYIRANGEMTWLLGPATIRAEYDQTNQRRDNLGVGGQNLPGVVAKGYTAQFTYVITGEDKPDAGAVSPKRNLFGDGNGKEGFGAWDLKFRYANLQIADGSTKSNRAESFYLGPNWYMNRYVRYMLDLGFERFKDPLRSPRPGEKGFFVVLSRVQVAF
jgi:phosphate-selective porin OprO/OprP